MKARVKATGEIVEAELKGFDNLNIEHYIINGNQNWILSEFSLDFLESDLKPYYWTRLEHQYAGMAMQGLLSNERCLEENADKIAEVAICYAKELVKGLRIERSN